MSMKKIFLCILLPVFLVAILLVACVVFIIFKMQPKVLNSYPSGMEPAQVIKTDDQWILLRNTYGKTSYTISVGEDSDATTDIYSVDNVSIWFFEANQNGIVWCEESREFYTYKIYVFETQKVETVFQVATDKGYQPQNIGIYLNTVYYCAINYDRREVQVIAYDITTKTTNDIIKVELHEELQPYSINLENEYLNFACSDQIKVINLQNNEVAFDCTLPDIVEYVFAVSYDSKNDTCALYYSDDDSEDIGVLKEGDTNIRSVFTFSQNHYAYQEKIECYDGHIYWIEQANVSGKVADHYRLVDYDYLKDKPKETARTFSFYRYGSELYLLRINEKSEQIDLCQY